MQNAGLPVATAISIASLLTFGGGLLPIRAIAQPRLATPTYTPTGGLLPKQTVYDCGNAGAITLTRDDKNRDRFTYEAVSTRGQKLTLKNGVGYASREGAIYTFSQKNGSTFIIGQEPNGKTTLTTSGKGISDTSFNCKITKITRSIPRR